MALYGSTPIVALSKGITKFPNGVDRAGPPSGAAECRLTGLVCFFLLYNNFYVEATNWAKSTL